MSGYVTAVMKTYPRPATIADSETVKFEAASFCNSYNQCAIQIQGVDLHILPDDYECRSICDFRGAWVDKLPLHQTSNNVTVSEDFSKSN